MLVVFPRTRNTSGDVVQAVRAFVTGSERVAPAGTGRWMHGKPQRGTRDDRHLPEFVRLADKPCGWTERTQVPPWTAVQGINQKSGNRSLKRDPNYASIGRQLA